MEQVGATAAQRQVNWGFGGCCEADPHLDPCSGFCCTQACATVSKKSVLPLAAPGTFLSTLVEPCVMVKTQQPFTFSFTQRGHRWNIRGEEEVG